MGRRSMMNRRWDELARVARYRSPELAKLCKVSSRQLRRQFQQYFGCSPQDWLKEQRIVAAERLLLTGELIKTVAYELGFKQTSHFCREFKSRKEVTPSEFVAINVGILQMSARDNMCPLPITD